MSSVAYQVMWNRLISVVEEQAQALVRTAFSTSVREAGDLSAGVYNADGLMLAQAEDGEHPREQHRREFQQIITLLSEETLDSVAIQTIFDSHVVETQGLLHSVARTWVQRLEGMSLEQRLKLAGRMQNHLERGPRRGKGENRDRY